MEQAAINKNESQGGPGGQPKKMRGRRLVSIADCRRALAAWIRLVEADEMEPEMGTKLTFMVNSLAGLIRDHELEERLDKLEQAREGT